MALRRIEIQDLPGGRPLPSGGMEPTDLPPLFRLGAMDPDTPLEVALGLKPGDRVRVEGGKGQIVRASGAVEDILGH